MRPPPRRRTRCAVARDGRVVGDDDRGGAEFLVGPRDGGEHHLSGLVIECTGRLVAQQHVGRLDDGASDRDALLFAAGKLGGEMIEPLVEADQRQRLPRGSSGRSAISFTSATFSSTVRLGMRS